MLPATLAEDGGAWRVRLHLAQAGAHRVAVSLGGGHVGGSPFTVQAEPAAACLAASVFEGAGLQQVRTMVSRLRYYPEPKHQKHELVVCE